jgi:hypothetical protein
LDFGQALLVVIAAIIVAAILLTSKPRETEKSSVGQTKTEPRRPDDEARIADPTICALQAIEIHWAPEEREHHRQERWYWGLTAILTFFAVGGAVATVILSQLSLDESRRATGEAIQATAEAHRQADEAHRQAEAAVEAAKTAREAFIASDRGRIGVIGTTVDAHAGDGGFKVAVAFMNYGKEAVILSKELWAKSFDDSEWSGGVPWGMSAPGKYISDLEAQCLSRNASAATFLATPYVGNNAYALNLDTIADLPPSYSIHADKDFFDGKTRLVLFACLSYDVNGVTKHTYACEWYKANSATGPVYCESGNRSQ